MNTKERNRNKSVQVLERSFAVLEAVTAERGEASLTQIGQRLSIPHSTIHRILSSLIQLGYVEQNPENGRYRLGLKFLAFSKVILENLDLRKTALPYLAGLKGATGETANLVVLDQDEVVYIEKAETPASLRVFSYIGHRAPVHATGAGKVLLSELTREEVEAMLGRKGLRRFTDTTITTVDAFLAELDRVRQQGFALDNEECEPGARCIAAPVHSYNGRIVAAISLSGPTARLQGEHFPELVPVVIEYGRKLSRALGFNH